MDLPCFDSDLLCLQSCSKAIFGTSFTAHHYNIQTFCIELYKVFSGQSQTIFCDLFKRKNINNNLRSQSDFVILQIKTVYKGSNSIRYFGPIIWSLMPKEIKKCDTLASFINKIRQLRCFPL